MPRQGSAPELALLPSRLMGGEQAALRTRRGWEGLGARARAFDSQFQDYDFFAGKEESTLLIGVSSGSCEMLLLWDFSS